MTAFAVANLPSCFPAPPLQSSLSRLYVEAAQAYRACRRELEIPSGGAQSPPFPVGSGFSPAQTHASDFFLLAVQPQYDGIGLSWQEVGCHFSQRRLWRREGAHVVRHSWRHPRRPHRGWKEADPCRLVKSPFLIISSSSERGALYIDVSYSYTNCFRSTTFRKCCNKRC